MRNSLLVKIALVAKRFFYVFLDVSGILLGIFLVSLGWWVASGETLSRGIGFVILFLGICAFLIHTGHYYSWRLTRWIFGSEDYFLTRKEKEARVR